MGAHRGAVVEVHGAHAHHPIMEQMRLQDAATVHAHAVAEPHEVRLRQPVALAPHPSPDPGAHRSQEQREHRRAADRVGEPRGRAHLDEGVDHLVAPHERAPQRVLPRADAAHDEPLGDDGEDRGHRAGDQQHRTGRGRGRPDPPRAGEGLQRDEHADADGDRAGDRHEPAQLHRRTRPPEVRGGLERAALVARDERVAGASPAGCRATTCRPSTSWAPPRARRPGRSWARSDRRRPSRSCRGTRASRPWRARSAASRRRARRRRSSCRRRGRRRRPRWSSWAAGARWTPPPRSPTSAPRARSQCGVTRLA